MAVDASGNVYFVSSGNVYVTPYNNYYSTTLLPLPAGETAGSYVAVDASGNVFFDATDTVAWWVVKATFAAGTYTSANLISLGTAAGVNGLALDAAGSLFVTYLDVTSLPAYTMARYNANGSATGQSVSFGSYVSSASTAMAVDASDDVYFLGPGSGGPAVQESLLGGGTYQTPATVLSGICSSCTLGGMAMGTGGALYFTDTTDGVVLRYPLQAGGGYSSTSVARIADALSSTTGLAVDSGGVIYTEDSYGGGYIDTLTPPAAANLGTAALGSSSGSTATLQFRFDEAVTLGSIAVTARGAPSLDFRNAGTGTCTAGQSYAQGALCTVDVSFTASNYAGPRSGGVSLLDSSGAVLGTGYVYGTATGSQFAYANPFSSQITTATTLSNPRGVAVDGNRAVYIVDKGNSQILRETPSGSTYAQTTVASGLGDVQFVAVDGDASVYFVSTDPLNSSLQAVFEVAPNGSGGYGMPTLVARGLSYPQGIAVDGSGNVYVADTINTDRIVKATNLGGVYLQTQLLSNLNNLHGIAVDGNGNLYMGYINGQILRSANTNGTYSTPVVLATGLGYPEGLAIDGAGDLYVADSNNSRVVRLAAGTWAQTVIGSINSISVGQPFGLAVDDAGSVYVSGTSGVFVAPAAAPSLSFATTDVGSTSSDSPKTVTIANIGTSTLTFASNPGLGQPDPNVSANFTAGSGSTCPLMAAGNTAPLASGATCDYLVSFAPTGSAGNLTGSMSVSYEDQNPGYTTSTVTLSGVAVYPVAATPTFSPAGGAYATARTVTISDTTQTFGAIYYTIDGSTPTTASRQYMGPVTVGVSETLKAIFAGSGYSQSAVASAAYTIGSPPVCSLSARGTSTPDAVAAVATCTDPQGSAISTYSFNWGDGTSPTPSTSNTAMHTYAAAGTYTVTLTATNALNDSSTTIAAVTPNQPPACTLTARAASTAGAATAQITCTDPQASAISSYSFNWGDGTTPAPSTSNTATHTYAAAGTYTVTGTGTDALGLTSTAVTQRVTPNQPPLCTLTASGTSTAGAVTASASCTDPQGSTVSSYSFNWGDGSTPTATTTSGAIHTYAAAGTYTVTLTAADALGLTSAAATQRVTPNQLPACSLIARATSTAGVVTAAATCTDPQASAIGSYIFTWGDGSSLPVAVNLGSHVYTSPGTYTVGITATDALGLTSAAVTQRVTPNQAPVCSLTVGGTSTPGAVTAQAACTDPQNSTIGNYVFNWGDGSQPTTGTLSSATHTYAAAAAYTVSVTATDALGVVGNAAQRVTPNQLPVCSIAVHGTAMAGAVAATASCTDPQGSAIANYNLNWGDGSSTPGTTSNAVHTYTNPATYTVTLTATDALGLSGVATARVTPNELPVCTLSVIQGTSTQLVNGVSMTYVTATPTCSDPQNQLLPPVIAWGDGSTSVGTSGMAANHGYVTPTVATTVPVVVSETDGAGLTGSATQAVALLAVVAPPAGMSANASGQAQQQPSGIAPTQVTFLCTGLQVGNSTVTVLPSQAGITCTSPTFTATSTSASNVTVSVQTTAATANTAWLGPRGSAVLAASLSLPGVLLLGLGVTLPSSRRRLRHHLRAGGVLLLLCCTLCSCGGGSFTPPPVVATPKGLYLLTITEVVTGGATPTSFVQTSLIVPLDVQ